jgi:hypothetical protein
VTFSATSSRATSSGKFLHGSGCPSILLWEALLCCFGWLGDASTVFHSFLNFAGSLAVTTSRVSP